MKKWNILVRHITIRNPSIAVENKMDKKGSNPCKEESFSSTCQPYTRHAHGTAGAPWRGATNTAEKMHWREKCSQNVHRGEFAGDGFYGHNRRDKLEEFSSSIRVHLIWIDGWSGPSAEVHDNRAWGVLEEGCFQALETTAKWMSGFHTEKMIVHCQQRIFGTKDHTGRRF